MPVRRFWWVTAAVLGAWALHNAFILPLEQAHWPAAAQAPLQVLLRVVVWLVPVALYLRSSNPRPPLQALGLVTALERRGRSAAVLVAAAYLALAAALAGPGGARPATAWPALAAFVTLTLLRAALEEVLMRGFVLRQQLRWSGPVRAQAVTAALFAAMHAPGWLTQGVPAAELGFSLAFLLVQGAALGFLAWRTGSILPAIAVHAANNLLAG
ncbi:MAG: CPBP family intramembrane metalloprotease [Anaeromyxobacteraceae bacterium]